MNSSIASLESKLCLLPDISPKDKPWNSHKQQSVAIAKKYLKGGKSRYSERILNCAKWLQFSFQEVKSKQELELKLFSTEFCRVRHCPVCQWRRSMRWIARLSEALPRMLDDNPKISFIFLTLTVKNCELLHLRETIQDMNKAWKKLSERKIFPAIGFLKSVEVTKSKDGTVHPHFHCILAVESNYFVGRNYLSTEKWANLWKNCLKVDYDPIVHVKKVKMSAKKLKAKPELIDDPAGQLLEAVRECVKYSAKPEDIMAATPEWLVALTNQLHKTRSISLGGIFKQYLSEDEPEDLIGQSEDLKGDKPEGDVTFGWKERLNSYALLG